LIQKLTYFKQKEDSWSSWMKCDYVVENCHWKRMKSCINASDPHIVCGEEQPWLDMRRNCLNCNSEGGWVRKTGKGPPINDVRTKSQKN